MPTATNGPVPIDYTDEGVDEPSLLLATGWCAEKVAFDDLRELLSRRRRTLSMDWRGHGRSGAGPDDFGENDLTNDALAVIAAARLRRVVPVMLAHAGWVAFKLRLALGERVPAIVVIDWLVSGAPPSFRAALDSMRSPERWRKTADATIEGWRAGSTDPRYNAFLDAMQAQPYAMWSRAGREISRAYDRERSPLEAFARLDPPVPVLHLYARPEDPRYLREQEDFARGHPWFEVKRLKARTHFPMYEVPDQMAADIDEFVGRVSRGGLAAAA